MSPQDSPPIPHLPPTSLTVRRIGIDTLNEPVVYMHVDCPVCSSEGFVAHARVRLNHGSRMVIGPALEAHDVLAVLEGLG
jgi:hypothetical protein